MKRLINKIGFTLIETLVVVGVIAILCGISIPGIIQAKHSMDVLEANSTAKELFVAAQNRLTSMKADGQLNDILNNIGSEKQIISNHYYQSTGDDALRQYLLSDSIFSNVKGDYIVELNPLSGDIIGVLYWAKNADLGEYLDSITEGNGIGEALNHLSRNDKKALAESDLIGYYDSTDANNSSAISGATAFNPEVKVINGNDLYLSVIQRNIHNINGITDFDLDKLYITLTFEDEHGRKNVLNITSSAKISEYKRGSDDSDDLELYFILDTIEDSVLGKLDYLKKPEAPTSNYLCEGDNMKVTVSLKYEDNDTLIVSTPASASFNSLFGTKTDIIIASTTTDITIWNIRHLKNLAKIKTVGDTAYADRLISVTQSMDIDGEQSTWSNVIPDGLSAVTELSAISPTRTAIDAGVFTSISPIILNPDIYSIDASAASGVHKIKNISLTKGLFFEITCDITGITIVNPVCTSSGSENIVGVLAGIMTKGNLKNCGVYYEDQNNTGTVNGNYYVGGLIGQILIEDEYTQTTITNCYANINVNGKKQVGGLFGYTDKNVQITNCYSSGSVTGQEYVGGFVGLADNTEISNCFTTSDVTGQIRTGGFMGFLSADDTVEKVKTLTPGKYQISNGKYYLQYVSTPNGRWESSEILTTTTDATAAGTEFYYTNKTSVFSLLSINQDYIYAYDSAKGEKYDYFIAKSNGTATYYTDNLWNIKKHNFVNMAYDYTSARLLTKIAKVAYDGVFNPDDNIIAIVNDGDSYYIVNFHNDNSNLLELIPRIAKFLERILNPVDGVHFWDAINEFDPADFSFLSIDDAGRISWKSTKDQTDDTIRFKFQSQDEDPDDDQFYYITNCYSYGKVNETAVSIDTTVGGFTVNDYAEQLFKNCYFLRDTNYNNVFPEDTGMGKGIHSQTMSAWNAAVTDALILNGTNATVKFQGWNAGLKYYWGNVPSTAE